MTCLRGPTCPSTSSESRERGVGEGGGGRGGGWETTHHALPGLNTTRWN